MMAELDSAFYFEAEHNQRGLDKFSKYETEIDADTVKGSPKQHPHSVLETAALSSVSTPRASYRLFIPDYIFNSGKLSVLQAETISLVCLRHEQWLTDTYRAGFFIGDGAGVGKGRTIAGVISENCLNDRVKSLWISVNSDLIESARRDFSDLGIKNLTISNLSGIPYDKKISEVIGESGCLFMTYATLAGGSKKLKKKRIDQVLEWLTPEFDGVIVFDECHKAKRLTQSEGRSPTAFATAVQKMQSDLRCARIVYSSATGACRPADMAYMTRLGLWGPRTPYVEFANFLKAMEQCGVVGMESLAMDMKHRGVYLARQLSFDGATFAIQNCSMSPEMLEMYNMSVEAWCIAYDGFQKAIGILCLEEKKTRMLNTTFWGAHQRYFKALCVSVKVPTVVAIARQALLDGSSVVVGLQSTGDANLMDVMEKKSQHECIGNGVSTCEGIFKRMMNHFPIAEEDEGATRRLNKIEGNISSAFASINFPENPLDELIASLGGPTKVAEMTGRKYRVILEDGMRIVQNRYKGISAGQVNIIEREAFMTGKKQIAIISDAASTGVSLHSDARVMNTKRRIHITVELPWAADKAVQQFGRTLRAGQVNAPHYVLCMSEIAGEHRFASAVAKRLEILGAITHADRRSTEVHNLGTFHVDNEHGQVALEHLLNTIISNGNKVLVQPSINVENFFKYCRAHLTLAGFNPEKMIRKLSVKTFLNRLIGVTMPMQNYIFDYFYEIYEAVVSEAKKSGQFNSSLVELSKVPVHVESSKEFKIGSHGICYLYTVIVEPHFYRIILVGTATITNAFASHIQKHKNVHVPHNRGKETGWNHDYKWRPR